MQELEPRHAGAPIPPGPRGLPYVYGAIHALIDAACVTSVYLAGALHQLEPQTAFLIVLGYDLLAFGSQWVFGLLTDRHQAARVALLAGIGLTAAAVVALPWQAQLTMVLAGCGNALFHLGAGALVLTQTPGKAAPSGVFVAPGALGLALGIWLGRDGGAHQAWPFLPLLAIALAAAWYVKTDAIPAQLPTTSDQGSGTASRALPIVILLLVSILVRSFVGMGGSYQCPKTDLVRVGIPLAAFLGKGLGGFLSDRLGWLEVAAGALLISAPLIAFGGGDPALILTGLLFFQMTMPVTLAATAQALPRQPAMAFGLTCLALILGALPTFSALGRSLYGPATFFSLILLSALAVCAGLLLLGAPPGLLQRVAPFRKLRTAYGSSRLL